MDLAFLRRAERLLAERQPARLDHAMLMAALAAQQAAGAASRPSPAPVASGAACEDDPLIELLLAGPGWRRAVAAQKGCFSRAEAGRRVNGL